MVGSRQRERPRRPAVAATLCPGGGRAPVGTGVSLAGPAEVPAGDGRRGTGRPDGFGTLAGRASLGRAAWRELGVDGLGIADHPPGPDHPPELAPKLTVRMVARLQGFPDSWQFAGRKTAAYR